MREWPPKKSSNQKAKSSSWLQWRAATWLSLLMVRLPRVKPLQWEAVKICIRNQVSFLYHSKRSFMSFTLIMASLRKTFTVMVSTCTTVTRAAEIVSRTHQRIRSWKPGRWRSPTSRYTMSVSMICSTPPARIWVYVKTNKGAPSSRTYPSMRSLHWRKPWLIY